MNAGGIIYSVLAANAPVAAVVSARIYPIDVPLEVDLPCVFFDVSLGPAVDGSAPMSPAQISVGCLAHTEAAAHSLAELVHTALNGLTHYSAGTWLHSMALLGRAESRDEEQNTWGIVLAYGAGVTF